MTRNKRRHRGCTDRWNSSLFIGSKLSAAQAPGWWMCVGIHMLLCFLTPVHLWRRDRERGFLYASFTLQTHHNSVVFQAFQSHYMNNSSPRFFWYDSLLLRGQALMNDDCSSVRVRCYCCKAQSEAYSIPGGLGFTATGWFSLFTPAHEGLTWLF